MKKITQDENATYNATSIRKADDSSGPTTSHAIGQSTNQTFFCPADNQKTFEQQPEQKL